LCKYPLAPHIRGGVGCKGGRYEPLCRDRVAAFGALLATAPGALATNPLPTVPGPINCPPNTFGPETIDGDVVVPNGMSCVMASAGDVVVTGNVTVGAGATLTVGARSATTYTLIARNLRANNCGSVTLNPQQDFTRVGGNLQVQNCSGSNPNYSGMSRAFVIPTGGTVVGNFQCQNNIGGGFFSNSVVGGNVQVMNNQAGAGDPSQVYGNNIRGNLQCQGNTIVGGGTSIVGSGNYIGGNDLQGSEGQCFGF
jgi:hypothetical protein